MTLWSKKLDLSSHTLFSKAQNTYTKENVSFDDTLILMDFAENSTSSWKMKWSTITGVTWVVPVVIYKRSVGETMKKNHHCISDDLNHDDVPFVYSTQEENPLSTLSLLNEEKTNSRRQVWMRWTITGTRLFQLVKCKTTARTLKSVKKNQEPFANYRVHSLVACVYKNN